MGKFKKLFRRLPDPRADNARHDLLEVLFIALAATLCGAESCSDMADFGQSKEELLRLFLRHTGATPSEIAATRRVQAAKRLMDETSMALCQIAFAEGFRSVRRFNDAFRATYGRAPSSLRRAG